MSFIKRLLSRRPSRQKKSPASAETTDSSTENNGDEVALNGTVKQSHATASDAVVTTAPAPASASASASASEGGERLPAIVGIFHDLENVHLPTNGSDRAVSELVRNLKRTLIEDVLHCSENLQIKAFKSYFDSGLTSTSLRRALSSAGIDTIDVSHLGNKDKDAVDKVMIVDSIFFFTDHLLHVDASKVHKVVVLLTGDRDFSVVAQRLAQRSVKVIVVLRDKKHPVHPSLVSGVFHVLYLSDLIKTEATEKFPTLEPAPESAQPAPSPPRAAAPKLSSGKKGKIIIGGKGGKWKDKQHPSVKKKEDKKKRKKKSKDVQIINTIKKLIYETDEKSLLCSRLGILLRESNIELKGVMAFLSSYPDIFHVEGTNGYERVSLKKGASIPMTGLQPEASIHPSLSLAVVRDTVRKHRVPILLTDLNARLLAAGVRPKGLRAFLESYPDTFTIEQTSEGPIVRLQRNQQQQQYRQQQLQQQQRHLQLPQLMNMDSIDVSGDPSMGANDSVSDETRIQAILDILDEHDGEWLLLSSLGLAMSERGFPKGKTKMSDLIRAYPDYFVLRGEGIDMEVASVDRLMQEQMDQAAEQYDDDDESDSDEDDGIDDDDDDDEEVVYEDDEDDGEELE